MPQSKFSSTLIILVCLIVAGELGAWFMQTKAVKITNFNECVKAGYPVKESYPVQCSTPDGKTFTQDTVKKMLPPVPSITQPVTIQGVGVCLPYKNQNGPQTLECAFGLKDNKGSYYALHDPDPSYAHLSNFPMGKQIKVTGNFTPKEDTKYQSIGILEISAITPI